MKPYFERFAFATEVTLVEEREEGMIFTPAFCFLIAEENDAEAKARREKRIAFLEAEISRSRKMLENPNFVQKAKPEKVALERQKYESYLEELKHYQD